MQSNESLQLLMTHAGQSEGERLANGILGMLRPYRGIIERNLHEVVDCLYHLHSDLGATFVRNDLVRSSMSILITMRNWAMAPTGMLRSNRLIDDASLIRLGNWYDIIENITIRYMSNGTHGLALHKYLEYLAGYETIDLIANDAVVSAITDSLSLGEDYQIVSLLVCAKYPHIGRLFRSEVAQRVITTPPGDLKEAMTSYLEQVADAES